ncbi:import inner membrane translocase subunit Tim44 [Burkholderia sp. lig30]|jgi:predicted lipid-binding transport protein (Tim44 family)|uniref:Tim44 domain-containing protein n=1 Tax=Burkholderia sp. lig30 TaxID=1192124 RepID=UPI00046112D5|nr:TIM44-like domain-containing protein [Burkholderia sp. lig30]KDB07969.1 import inner membrane translocase subunit Tim44 [Burkholderia sp. lig30]
MSESRSLFNRKEPSKPWARRVGTLLMVGLLTAGTFASLDAEAKRMGGGRSVGRQSQSITQRQATPPAQQPMQQAAPSQAQRAQPGAAAPAAQPNRSRWLGPIAGLAAGLGIAALLSHFGLGGAFASMMANVIVIALLAMVGIWVIRKIMNRRRSNEPAYAAGGTASSAGGPGGYSQQGTSFQSGSGSGYASEAQQVFGGGAPAAAPAAAAVQVPAGFDTEAFLRSAKVYFVRLQAAWDQGNMADIREFTTPEMFAEIKIDLDGRGNEKNQTDVVQLDAELLEVDDRGIGQSASVRFHGLIRESAGAPAAPFEEVWNLSKSGGQGWLLAGIQQLGTH